MNGAASSLSVRLGQGASLGCHTYPNKPGSTPILWISGPGFSFDLYSGGRGGVTGDHVRMAHQLAEAVAVFVADLERLHALNDQDSDQDGAGSDAGSGRAA
jgi:hypothetical protein